MSSTTTYTIMDNGGVHSFTIEENVVGTLLMTDQKFSDLITWMQSNGLLASSGINGYVVRPQEHIIP